MANQISKSYAKNDLDRLFDIIMSRKGKTSGNSYTAELFAGAPAKPARKLCEEATEVLIEALNGDKAKLTAESADLLYQLLVVWAAADINPQDVWQELERRQGMSGLVEKQNRLS